jgi:hypothetical protein
VPSELLWNGALTRLKSDKLFGEQNACQPPPRVINEKPLGIDRLQQIWEANSDSRLMELFLWHFRRWGNTLDQVFLGTQAFGTIDLLNLQTVLSTKFDGNFVNPHICAKDN